jgi:hypothetical protein
MLNKYEKKLLIQLTESTLDKNLNLSAFNFLVACVEDYVNLPVEQSYFFLMTNLLNQLKKTTNDKESEHNAILQSITEINKLSTAKLKCNQFELCSRLKFFFQIYPEYIEYLNAELNQLLQINPSFYKSREPDEKQNTVNSNDNIKSSFDNDFFNMDTIEVHPYLSYETNSDANDYINYLIKLDLTEIQSALSNLIHTNHDQSQEIHNFNMKVLCYFIDTVPHEELESLADYTIWNLSNCYSYCCHFPLYLLGKLHSKTINITLTDADINGPINESHILSNLNWLMNSHHLPQIECIKILDGISKLLPKTINIIFDYFSGNCGKVHKKAFTILLEKIDLATEEQKLGLFKNVYSHHFSKPTIYNISKRIYDKSKQETKNGIRGFLYNEVKVKAEDEHNNKLYLYINLVIINDDHHKTILDLINLLKQYQDDPISVEYILSELKAMTQHFEMDDYLLLADIIISNYQKLISEFGCDSDFMDSLRFFMNKSNILKERFIELSVDIIENIVTECDDEDCIEKLLKVMSIFLDEKEYSLNKLVLEKITQLLYRTLKNNFSMYFEKQYPENPQQQAATKQVNEALMIITCLRYIMPESLFTFIGDEFLKYLFKSKCKQLISINFIANNIGNFPKEMQNDLFNNVMSIIFQPGKSDLAPDHYNYIVYNPRPTAISLTFRVFYTFSINNDNTLNVNNSIRILKKLITHTPSSTARYINQFPNEYRDFIEKYAMLIVNTLEGEAETNRHVQSFKLDLNKTQYLRYYHSVIKEKIDKNINNEDLTNIIIDYVIGPLRFR